MTGELSALFTKQEILRSFHIGYPVLETSKLYFVFKVHLDCEPQYIPAAIFLSGGLLTEAVVEKPHS